MKSIYLFVVSISYKRILLLLACFFMILSYINAQSSNQNYILTRTMTDSTGTKYLDKIEYFDGLGRLIQTVEKGITRYKNDLVTFQEYDNMGRESNRWLPTPYPGNGSFADSTTITSAANAYYYNDVPYSHPVYESSPLNRVLEQYGPGKIWQRDSRSVKSEFLFNNNGDRQCSHYYATADKLIKSDNYANCQLYVTKTTDEDGHVVYEFKDKQGQLILNRQINNEQNYDTYYVYDDLGNLRFVLPPMATDRLTGVKNYEETEEALQNYAYIYHYDGRKRCIWKKLPGAEAITMVYDKADHLIFSQDGNQRELNEWSFSIPDVFSRVVITGICSDTTSVRNSVISANFVNGSSNFMNTGYQLSSQINSCTRLLTVNYYDNYDYMSLFPDSIKTNLGYTALSLYASEYKNTSCSAISAKGMLTGSLVFMLEDATKKIMTSMYYDYKGRLAQSKSTNHLGGYEKDYFSYTFMGEIDKHKHGHTGKKNIDEIYKYDYDHAGRLQKTTHSLNGLADVTLNQNNYDEQGQLSTKTQNNVETTTYTYNIRSWLKNISNSSFNQSLFYNDSITGNKYYNGNISAMLWSVKGDTLRGYNFEYDNLNRITKSNYLDNKYNGTYSYDKMGNITSLTRYGLTDTKSSPYSYGIIDDLTLNYDGNQLSSIKDASTSEPSYFGAFNFPSQSCSTLEYTYDANGNLTRDSHKKIAKIQYNLLNLPSALQLTQGHTTEYLYDAAGVKRRVKQITAVPDMFVSMGTIRPVSNDSIKTITQTDYCGNVIYENGALSKILVDGGYITMSGTTPVYHYCIQDHQGNNRVVFNQNGIIEQTNHYYPFGMTFGESVDNSDNRYKYNGKELDRMHGLDLYDYGARHYDAAIGRWGVMDPLAEKYYSVSPYTYCANNPIRFIDPDGRDWFVNNKNGNLLFLKGITEINDEVRKKYNLEDDKYENFGGDSTFGKTVRYQWTSFDGVNLADNVIDNILDYNCVKFDEISSSNFMNSQGYTKAENTLAEEDYIQTKDCSYDGKIDKQDVYSAPKILDNDVTYVRPNELNRMTNVSLTSVKGDWSYIETVSYNIIRPYGQSVLKTSYYKNDRFVNNMNNGAKGANILLDILSMLKGLFK